MVTILSDNRGSGNPDKISYGRKAGNGYQYVMKHGLGPGTLPSGVGIIRSVCLSNYLTIVYLDRPLELDELAKFDIPNESNNKKYLSDLVL